MNFKKQIFAMAKQDIKTIVFPEASFSDKIMQAVKIIVQKKLAKIILIGDETAMYLRYSSVNSSDLKIINSKTSSLKEEVAQKLFSIFEQKGMTKEQAISLAEDPYYFATMLVKLGYADGIVSGAESHSMEILKPAFEILTSNKNKPIISSGTVFIGKNRFLKNKPVLISDSIINYEPNAQQIASIAKNASDFWKELFLEEPKIAFLSNSTMGSSENKVASKMREATKIFVEKYPEVICDGEVQLDVALDAKSQAKKYPDSKIKGDANILIVPDAISGNLLAKSFNYIGGLTAVGPISFGFDAPISDISRNASVEEIVLLCVLTAIQAQS